jgi:manganese/zinc/iron transport system substrate-binding protein
MNASGQFEAILQLAPQVCRRVRLRLAQQGLASPTRRYARLVGLCVTGCLAMLAGCTGNANSNPSRSPDAPFTGKYPIQATVTVGMLGDLVRQIGGEHVQVTQLMGAGVDPHLFKPLRDAVLAIRNADIVFYNGLLLEGKMSDLLAQQGRTHRTFAAGDVLSTEIVGGDDPHSGHPDPHIWMNVALWSQVAEGVGKELAEFDPPHAAEYAQATEQLRRELAELHEYGKAMIACIPAEQRVLVTSHDAFRYFGEAYGVEVQAVQGISTESEAGLSRINELVDMLVARKVGAIFTESSVPQDSIRALLRGAESKGHQVRIADQALYSDAMGEAGTYAGTYIGMMDHNLTTIARELGCPNVPAGGFRESQSNILNK